MYNFYSPHVKLSFSLSNILKLFLAGSSLPLYDRDKEEMEILKRYIRKQNPHMEYMCNCAKTMADMDFNRHFNRDYKVSDMLS